MIRFEEEGHRYYDGDRERVSVTRALQDAGLINTDYFLPKHAHRGKMVHRACMMEAQKILEPTSLDPQIAGYVQGWRKFLSDLNATITTLEYITCDLELGYAGRIDCKLSVPGRDLPVLVDIKSGSPSSWHKIQLGAYVRTEMRQEAAVLYLRPTGRYRFNLMTWEQQDQAVREFESLMHERDNLFAEAP